MRVNGEGKAEKETGRWPTSADRNGKRIFLFFEMQNLSSNYVCPAMIVGIDRCAKQICSRCNKSG